MCTAATGELTQLYGRFGFKPAIEGTDFGFLYMPLGNSPDTFREFHKTYYQPSDILYHRRASINYRHEIDCLLRFTYKDMGLEFGKGIIFVLRAHKDLVLYKVLFLLLGMARTVQ